MSSVSVLLVVSNTITRQMVKLALELEGYVVVEASDGANALAAVKQEIPDIVLQETVLPDMDAIELVHQIRGVPGAKDLPILGVSATSTATLDPRVAGCFTDCLPKPIEPLRLFEAIEKHLGGTALSLVDANEVKGSVRVLVVDDERIERRWIQVQLMQLGLDVSVVASGSEALAAAGCSAPDIIVSDVLMPEMDGFQLCRRVRQDPRLANVRFVLTGSDSLDTVDNELAVQVGADAFALKTSELKAVVGALASRGPSAIAELTAGPMNPKTAETHTRVLRQMEAQASQRADATRSNSILGLIDSFLSRVQQLCAYPVEVEQTLGEVLASYLDASGFGLGAALLCEPGGQLSVRACLGDPEWLLGSGKDFFGHSEWIHTLMQMGEPVGWTDRMTPMHPAVDIAALAKVRSILVVPLRLGVEPFGIIVLASHIPELPANWSTFAKALQGPIAQAIGLGRTVARLSASEKRFRGIAEATTDGIVVTDLGGAIVYVNPALTRMTGAIAGDWIGGRVATFCPGLDICSPQQNLHGVRRDGSQFPVEASTETYEDGADGSHRLHILRDLTERVTLEEMRRWANLDPLTELHNRRRFDEELGSRVSEACRYDVCGALLLVDLDGFKAVNDTHGHPFGDTVLKDVARALKRVTRDSDFVARIGGDEFAVILPHAIGDGACECACRILDELAKLRAIEDGGTPSFGASIGIALFVSQGRTSEGVLAAADKALYFSKRAGRNRATLQDEESGAQGDVTGRSSETRLLRYAQSRLAEGTLT